MMGDGDGGRRGDDLGPHANDHGAGGKFGNQTLELIEVVGPPDHLRSATPPIIAASPSPIRKLSVASTTVMGT
jgi:hypothetical protein